MLVYMHLYDTDESSPLSLFFPGFHLYSHFLFVSCCPLSLCPCHHFCSLASSSFCPLSTDQRLDLNKLSPNDSDTVRGQIVGEYCYLLVCALVFFFNYFYSC